MNVTGFFFAFLALFAMASALSKCPEVDGPFAVSTVNPEDCTTFFLCNRGNPVLTLCPGGLAYNEEIGVCDYPNTREGCYIRKELYY